MEIRKLGPGDESLVISAGHLFDDAPQLGAVRRFLNSPDHHLFFAIVDGRPVGFVSGVELTHPDKGTEMFLYELGVDEVHRGRGIGKALVTTLRDLARQRGCYDMWTLSEDDNEAALRSYRAGGAAETTSHLMLTWPLSDGH